MKILVLFTGGTIGSIRSSGYIGLDQQSGYPLLSLYEERMKACGMSGGEIEFITRSPYQRLSENNTGETLRSLADVLDAGIRQAVQEGCQGILVTHGTDTLAYSAAFAGYLFADSPLPIVFVSANYVLTDPRSNGMDNFSYAVEFVKQHQGGGVYVSYRNTGDLPRIHWGTRVLGHQAYSDAVYSLGGAYDTNHGGTIWNRSEMPVLLQNLQWDAPILQIHPAPGMRYPQIAPEIRAVLHHSYHAGTICSETPGIDGFFAEARERQIPVFLTGADPEMVYESMKIYDTYGIHVLPPASPIAMYIKLWLLIASDRDPVEWMNREIAGEFGRGD